MLNWVVFHYFFFRVLEEIEQRFVIQQVSFDSEGKALGVSGKQLKNAMMLFWILRYQREQLEYYTLQESCVWNLIRKANSTVLQNGLPTGINHVCSNVGAVHLKDVNGVCVIWCI